ncbi:flavin reductase family protein [Desulfobaculum sp.]
MKQTPIDSNFFPVMPVALLGTTTSEGAATFMTVGWCSRVNAAPPMIAVGVHNSHQTGPNILRNQAFSLCFPDSDLVERTDYCGIVSSKKTNKSAVFSTFTQNIHAAPLITECPINLECTLHSHVELPSNTIFIGEIQGAYAREDVLVDGSPSMEAMHPLLLTMPDNRYWTLGDVAGQAWRDGVAFKKRLKNN